VQDTAQGDTQHVVTSESHCTKRCGEGERFDRPMLGFLSRPEMQAILDAPSSATWAGQRDRALFTMLYNTGARVSEIIGVRIKNVILDASPAVHIMGKGRKERSVPLWRSTVRVMQA
jgi:integrase/recombinase XerD